MIDVLRDVPLMSCESYEDYIDSYILTKDIAYLRNIRLCRMLVALGYRSMVDVYSPAEFELHRQAIFEYFFPTKAGLKRFSENMTSTDPVVRQFAFRERLNSQKIISTIIFIKYVLKSGFEISGYIDYQESLRDANLKKENCVDWEGVFNDRCLLRPKPTDLSYVNWQKGLVCYNDTDNYHIMHGKSLKFLNKGDHKVITFNGNQTNTDSKSEKRCMHFSRRYSYIVFYDHIIRKKA